MPTLKSVRRFKRITGHLIKPLEKKRIRKPPEVPNVEELDLRDPLVSEIWTRIGRRNEDYKIAVRCAKYYRELFNVFQGTIPEILVYDWLTERGEPFHFQANFFGGRQAKGGVIPDFIVWPGGRGIALFIDTVYWHGKPEVQASDVADRIRLLGAFFQGIRIELVIAVWENRLYEDRNKVMQFAMMGVEIPR